ncbi:hypothetical protein BGW36DRAFT_358934 [Talaromyces proteolyticus]|uniref:Phosphatidate phosphatase APP1 catalytic domain-containing protein n=1 Tax=Talaromyces proteolyticus TaxID=1131652 RepID=A0AAD4PXX3_9EURO|nr:uncharacterized protein BGW36DRAFT_358934 [Talaromyces proteolyticus]KAH8697124.1 hypothetical protein BGW36DRAFT_358934 [Talaromyces proteolyticus]
MERIKQKAEEKPEESAARRAAGFSRIEKKLPSRFSRRPSDILRSMFTTLRSKNPLAQPVNLDENIVWLFDNHAYQPIHPYPHKPQPWQIEVVACAFVRGRNDISEHIATVADTIGLDGKRGDDGVIQQRIAQRLQPLLYSVAPARTMVLKVPSPLSDNTIQDHGLGPTNSDGILSQIVSTPHRSITDGLAITSHLEGSSGTVTMTTTFAVPEGWLLISDIDDSIKLTQTSDAVGILRTTFAEEPQPIQGMPELYRHIEKTLSPAWIYLSASPYNLYQFLRDFLHAYYHPGTLILRENSWHDLGGFLKSYSMGTQAYKADRIDKIHGWFPQRKVLCVGDSTQSDPEAYAELYRKYKGWIRAIFIRKVTNIPHMDEKNSDGRFQKAFEGIPDNVWTVFEQPEELYQLVDNLKANEAAGSNASGVQALYEK